MRIHTPEVATAVRIYHTYPEIGTKEIEELFGGSCNTIAKLKKRAREEMQKNGIITCHYHNVNTKAAYRAWGLNIHDLEKQYKQLKELGFL